MGELLDTLRDKLWPKPVPGPAPLPTPNKPVSPLDYVKAWQLFKSIPIHQLAPAVCSVSVVLFLAISGLLAWIVVILRFMFEILFMFKR